MLVRFFISSKGKAVAFKCEVITRGMRENTQCKVVANTAIRDLNNCFKDAQREAEVTDNAMKMARDNIVNIRETIDLDITPSRNGGCDCSLYWVSKSDMSAKTTPKLQRKAEEVANTLYTILSDIRELGKVEPNPKWLKLLNIKKVNY